MKLPLRYDAEQQAIFDADGDCILTMTNSDFYADKNDEHARKIVAACNTHEVLVKALTAARRTLLVAITSNVELADFDPAEHVVVEQIDAALALCKPRA